MSALRWLPSGQVCTLIDSGTTAFRIASGRQQFVDWWDGRVLLSTEVSGESPALLEEVRNWCGENQLELRSAYHRELVRNPGPDARPVLLFGESEPGGFEVLENGMRFGICLEEGYSPGLFPDQRENRRVLRERSPGKVLNLFCYTCAFSVAGALSGAVTTSVDLSKKFLQTGRKNFSRNGISHEGHRFVAEDAQVYLRRLAARGERFDWIVLDPPTFSRSKKSGVFQAERDFGKLVDLAMHCASDRAWVLLSTNCRTMGVPDLGRFAQESADRLGFQHFATPGLVPPDFSARDSSSTLLVELQRLRA